MFNVTVMNVILSVAKNPAEYIARSLTSAPSADASGVDLKVRLAQDDNPNGQTVVFRLLSVVYLNQRIER